MYCRHCGSKIEDDSVFCSVCGSRQDDDSQIAVNTVKEPVASQLCPSCNAVVDSDSVFCSKCGTNIENVSSDDTRQSTTANSRSEPQKRGEATPSSYNIAPASNNTDSSEKTGSSRSLHVTFDSNWSTNYGATIVGMIMAAALNVGFNTLESTVTTVEAFIMVEIFSIAYTLGNAYYAFIIYPTFFTSSPSLRNVGTASFLNGLFGGIIFGCLWNTCLTKHKKGVSYIVSGIGAILGTLVSAYNIYWAMTL